MVSMPLLFSLTVRFNLGQTLPQLRQQRVAHRRIDQAHFQQIAHALRPPPKGSRYD